MSGRESLGRGGPAVAKLKEGLQDAIVFLQTLGSYKIPAVIERRRKELLDKLNLLQHGGSVKDAPVVELDLAPLAKDSKRSNSTTTKETENAPKEVTESSENSSTASSTVTSPNHGKPKRRDSALVSSIVKDYESIHTYAKKEEESETPKRFVTLKRVAKPTDFPANAEDSGADKNEEEKSQEEKSEKQETKEEERGGDTTAAEVTLEVSDARLDRASSAISGEESNGEEEEDDKKKKKKNKKSGGLGLRVKGFMKRDKSPAPVRKQISPPAESPIPPESDKKEEEQDKPEEPAAKAEELQEEEEGIRMSGVLGRMKKKMGLGKSAKQVNAKVCETTLLLGDKEELDLTKCTVEMTDSGFDLTQPQHKTPIMFKVDGDAELKEKWVAAIREAIEKATPQEEEKTEPDVNDSVPSITVEDAGPIQALSKKGRKDSKTLTVKPEKKLPDKGVALKGSFLRKKPGISRGWEKTYCVLSYQAFYFSNEADTKDYSNMLPIYPNMDVKLESRKGKGDNPGICLKMGKKQEHFSFENQEDSQRWKSAIEDVFGLGGVEELLSEDEEADENAEPEELYEELELEDSAAIPPIPASPRPSRPNMALPSTPAGVQDDFAIDEDIYEDTDDILPPMPVQPSPQHAPSLPNRNASRNTAPSGPVPSLPPRNEPAVAAAPVPSLPPRSGPGGKPAKPPSPLDYEVTPPNIGAKPKSKMPVRPPIAATTADDEDQDLYDDVVAGEVGGGESEEMYDDVVVGEQDLGEELYDDVMMTSGLPVTNSNSSSKPAPAAAGSEPICDEFYEDMAPTGVSSDPYVALEKNKEEECEPGDELYMDVDMDEQPPPPQVQKVQTTIPAKPSSPRISSPFSKIKKGGGSSSNTNRGLVSGSISYKAPKKYKFDERWGCVEGTNLLVFKSSSDKRHQDKVALGDCRLDIGSTEAGAGKFAFSLSKGDKYYHFSLRSQADVDSWVGVIKGIVKYAPVESPPTDNGAGPEEELEVFQAREDHIADTDGELTFKKGTIIKLIDRPSKDMWYGQIGNESQVFTGKTGKFPAHKVEIAEDLYI